MWRHNAFSGDCIIWMPLFYQRGRKRANVCGQKHEIFSLEWLFVTISPFFVEVHFRSFFGKLIIRRKRCNIAQIINKRYFRLIIPTFRESRPFFAHWTQHT